MRRVTVSLFATATARSGRFKPAWATSLFAGPAINDRRTDAEGNRITFTSKILPPYLRRTKSLEDLIPWLYLKGVSTGGFSEALAALLGKDAPGTLGLHGRAPEAGLGR